MVSKSRLYIPALGETYESLAPYAELLLRAGLGVILFVHGLQKFFAWFGGAGIERTAPIAREVRLSGAAIPDLLDRQPRDIRWSLAGRRVVRSAGGVRYGDLHAVRGALHVSELRFHLV
jgi:hypothetical protein